MDLIYIYIYILRDFKVIVIYLKILLTFKYRQFSLIPLSMAAGVCKQKQQRSTRMAIFLRGYDKIPLSIMWKEEERHILSAGCVYAP